MPRSVRSGRSNSICSVTSDTDKNAKLDILASRVKMVKKAEKGLNKEKNQSATSQEDIDSNKALVEQESETTELESVSESQSSLCKDEPHVCTGNFQNDFTELCRRANMTYIPPILARPRPPQPSNPQEASPVKGGKDKGKQAAQQPDPEPEELTEDGEPVDAPPKTYTTKDKFEYFKPSIQVEQDHPDKPETVTEIYIRGWKIDAAMMDIFLQCWPTMEKLHTINLWSVGLTSDTLHTLATIVYQCTNLKNLTLDGNTAEEENWYELITEESSIQNLSLRHCGITDKGAVMIGRCLGSVKRSNMKLLSLNLNNNKVRDAGLEEISQGLRMNRTLLSLSLGSNQISDKGVTKLSEVLSRFPLTHDEVVERRRQKSDRSSPDRNKSPPLSRRADSKDRPGSVRSNTHAGNKKNEKPSAKGKKDAKGGKEEKDDKHDKTKGKGKEKDDKPGSKKDHLKVSSHPRAASPGGRHGHDHHWGGTVGGRGSGASIIADTAKGGKQGKGGKPSKDKKPATAEHETSDSPEFINPLLEAADFIEGQLWVTGNRVLININLSRNQIGESGMAALLKAMQYQTTLSLDNKTNGTGLMRLILGKNSISASHDLVQKLSDIMLPKDPFYKPPPQTPDVHES